MTSSNPAESAQHAALGWLSNGEHSASAVHDRLTKAGYETSVAKSVVIERVVVESVAERVVVTSVGESFVVETVVAVQTAF